MGGYVRTKHVGRNGREAARGSRRPCRIPEVSRGWLPRHFSLGLKLRKHPTCHLICAGMLSFEGGKLAWFGDGEYLSSLMMYY